MYAYEHSDSLPGVEVPNFSCLNKTFHFLNFSTRSKQANINGHHLTIQMYSFIHLGEVIYTIECIQEFHHWYPNDTPVHWYPNATLGRQHSPYTWRTNAWHFQLNKSKIIYYPSLTSQFSSIKMIWFLGLLVIECWQLGFIYIQYKLCRKWTDV